MASSTSRVSRSVAPLNFPKLTTRDLGDVLDVLEYRHDWVEFSFTWDLFRYVLLNLIPELIVHSQSQDEEQVRDHYDRGDDFYQW